MSYQKRLDQAFENVPVLPLDDNHKYVVFSDCHRGSGNNNDNFIKNEHLYLAALLHYNRMQYTYVELGDGDELWENRKMEQILEVHNRAFEQLALFYRDDRLYMVYGNHDMVKKNASFCNKKCQLFYSVTKQCHEPLFPNVSFYSGLILRNYEKNTDIYMTHGHQASLMNSTLWQVNRFLVRYVWKPLEQIGVLDPTSAAKNYSAKQRTERRLSEWAAQRGKTLITGHTHRPMNQYPDSFYINSGSCVHPYQITCLELEGDEISLVKWYMDARKNGNLYVERRLL